MLCCVFRCSLGKGEAIETTLAALQVVPEPFRSFANTLVDICAYAGTVFNPVIHVCKSRPSAAVPLQHLQNMLSSHLARMQTLGYSSKRVVIRDDPITFYQIFFI